MDVGFLAIEPEREAELAFTAPYALIEGVYVVPEAGAVRSPADVDRHGVRVGVKRGSAYDLFLDPSAGHGRGRPRRRGGRCLRRGGAGGRGGDPATGDRLGQSHAGHRVLEPAFMQIRQAVATRRTHDAARSTSSTTSSSERKASGFVTESFARAGRSDVTVAPPG